MISISTKKLKIHKRMITIMGKTHDNYKLCQIIC